jgi:hypothetical protein
MLFKLRINVGLTSSRMTAPQKTRGGIVATQDDILRADAKEIQEIVHGDAIENADSRYLLYERIAQGNALAEAEEYARRQWGG